MFFIQPSLHVTTSHHWLDLHDFGTENNEVGTGYTLLESILTTSCTSSFFHLHRLFLLLVPAGNCHRRLDLHCLQRALHCNRYQNNCCHESAFFCPKARKEQRLASTSLHFSTVLGTPKLKTVSEFYCSVHTDHEKTPTQFARPYFAVAKGSNSLAFKLISITTVPYKL